MDSTRFDLPASGVDLNSYVDHAGTWLDLGVHDPCSVHSDEHSWLSDAIQADVSGDARQYDPNALEQILLSNAASDNGLLTHSRLGFCSACGHLESNSSPCFCGFFQDHEILSFTNHNES